MQNFRAWIVARGFGKRKGRLGLLSIASPLRSWSRLQDLDLVPDADRSGDLYVEADSEEVRFRRVPGLKFGQAAGDVHHRPCSGSRVDSGHVAPALGFPVAENHVTDTDSEPAHLAVRFEDPLRVELDVDTEVLGCCRRPFEITVERAQRGRMERMNRVLILTPGKLVPLANSRYGITPSSEVKATTQEVADPLGVLQIEDGHAVFEMSHPHDSPTLRFGVEGVARVERFAARFGVGLGGPGMSERNGVLVPHRHFEQHHFGKIASGHDPVILGVKDQEFVGPLDSRNRYVELRYGTSPRRLHRRNAKTTNSSCHLGVPPCLRFYRYCVTRSIYKYLSGFTTQVFEKNLLCVFW